MKPVNNQPPKNEPYKAGSVNNSAGNYAPQHSSAYSGTFSVSGKHYSSSNAVRKSLTYAVTKRKKK